MKNMGDYHDHYLKKDLLLSADVFEKFTATCIKFYGFDPWWVWSDIDKYLFIEKELRGRFSYIAKRYAKVNNKYMNSYDPTKQ